MDRFGNKVVVITGGGSGLGRQCALDWAAEGGKMVVTDVVEKRADGVAREINDLGGAAIALKGDVKLESDMEDAVKAAVAGFGRLDIMFANAGKAPEGFGTVPLEDVTEEQWRDVNDVVYTGVFLAAKHACRQMKRHGSYRHSAAFMIPRSCRRSRSDNGMPRASRRIGSNAPSATSIVNAWTTGSPTIRSS